MQTLLKRLLEQFPSAFRAVTQRIRKSIPPTREQMRDLFASTSDQVLEKAEETRQAVRLRMAQMEIDHYLNRLYPQIGKQFFEQFEQSGGSFAPDEDLRLKLELAAEYRRRLEELRDQVVEQQHATNSGER